MFAEIRIQIFDASGNYVEEWGDLNHPDTIHIDADDFVYVAEMDQRISILSLDGELLARWGDGVRREAPGRACRRRTLSDVFPNPHLLPPHLRPRGGRATRGTQERGRGGRTHAEEGGLLDHTRIQS